MNRGKYVYKCLNNRTKFEKKIIVVVILLENPQKNLFGNEILKKIFQIKPLLVFF